LKKLFALKIVLFTLIFSPLQNFAQDSTSSLAFKKNQPSVKKGGFFYRPDLSYQLLQQFNLMREANAGDPLAQHELGIRYLLGEGISADTLEGAYWIGKAASQNLTAACYNYGILLLNGWGIDWNPFEAYNYFLKAAQDEMPAAQHVLGILYTDNLVVKRDWSEAYYWMNKSAQKGYEPAKETLKDIEEKIDVSKLKSDSLERKNISVASKNGSSNNENGTSIPSSLGLVFIDFETITDSVREIADSTLLYDIYMNGTKDLVEELGLQDKNFSEFKINSTGLNLLSKHAEAGSPDALTLIGRFYETGNYFPKNLITAAAYYLRAVRLDSPRSPLLLWEMTKPESFYNNLRREAEAQNPEALFVWYGLFSLQFDNRITERDAVNLLENSAAQYYLPAITELGLNYYTGKFIKENKQKALDIWNAADNLGSMEARIRLAAAEIFGFVIGSGIDAAIKILNEGEKQGSILAQVTLAYCYENGIGVGKNKAEAVKQYRNAAQRGSRYGYAELQRIYNEIRPSDSEFSVN
jgi:uncharacterized protein